MELTELLDKLHDVCTGTNLGVPTWTREVSVTGRTYSPRHVVCVGDHGHHHCLAQRSRSTPTTYTVAERARRGNGGRSVVCTGEQPIDVALTAEQLPEVSWDFVYGTNMQHGIVLARRMLARQTGTKQIIKITDGEPTAHINAYGEPEFHYPPVRETVDATLLEVARCTKDGIRINTFMLDPDRSLQHFIEQMTKLNGGRAFFTTPQNLGDYVLVDFIEQKREMLRGRR